MNDTDRVRFVGHATVEIEVSGVVLLTDPFLRDRVGPLVRRPPSVDVAALAPEAVLISHLDRDHLDLPSLRSLAGKPRLLVPRGGAAFARRHGFDSVTELAVGESTSINGLDVTAVPAVHDGRRAPYGPTAEAIGYLITGSSRVYFAGDTDLFDGMADLSDALDLALIPITGWGPTLPAGHLDPERAARALTLLRPRMAVPIHWGTLHPLGLGRFMSHQLSESPHEFARQAARLAPGVEVRVLAPGESLALATSPGSGDDSAAPRGKSSRDG